MSARHDLRSLVLAALAVFALSLSAALAVPGCGDDVVDMTPSGCKDDSTCTVFLPFCEVATGRCLACPGSMTCGKDQVCRQMAKGLECVEPCKTSADCEGAANTCCNNMCVSLESVQHCGACGNACGATQDCVKGMCKCPARAPDSCGMACVALDSDVKNCGTCGKDCGTTTNGYTGCDKGMCKVAGCNNGWGNCDAMDANGCETMISTDVKNCGMCGMVCTAPANSQPQCRGGKCAFVCEQNFRDCNNMPEDGCEIDVMRDSQHCGNCTNSICPMGQMCVAGVCM